MSSKHLFAELPRPARLNSSLTAALQAKIDGKTKPLGALGQLETLALQIGQIQDTLTPRIVAPHILVAAADHGAAKAGVSAYPQEVTWQMVENFLAGGAAINVLARQANAQLVIADAGVAHVFGERAGLLNVKVGAGGTANYLEGPAMTAEQCEQAMQHGVNIVANLAATGCNTLGFGEMGIGNTASASLLTHCLTSLALDDVIGRGTGLDDAGLAKKRTLLAQAVTLWDTEGAVKDTPLDAPSHAPLDVLARFGGFEIALLTGAMLAAAARRMVLVIDGFIVTSALLVASRIAPEILDYCVFSHCSSEAGHRLQLAYLDANPLLNLALRLGEGTGAALALPLLAAACAVLNEMASFASAGVSEAT